MYTDFLMNRNQMLNCLRDLDVRLRAVQDPKEVTVILLLGESAVLAGYHFRQHITAVDAHCTCSCDIRQAAREVAAARFIPEQWLGSECYQDGSYSNQLLECSVLWRRLSRSTEVRTISGPALIASRLRASARSPYGLADVLGILAEEQAEGNTIAFEQIDEMIERLYHGWSGMPENAYAFLQQAIQKGNYEDACRSLMAQEKAVLAMTVQKREDFMPSPDNTDTEAIAALAESRSHDWSRLKGTPLYVRKHEDRQPR
jgi:hypothetical protein